MEDLDALMQEAEQSAFGKPWEIRDSVGGPWHPISGIFDRRHVTALDQEGAAQTMRRVTLSIRAAELPRLFVVREGDLVRRALTTETYVVTDPQPDAGGGILLILGARVGGPAAP